MKRVMMKMMLTTYGIDNDDGNDEDDNGYGGDYGDDGGGEYDEN